MPGHSLRLHPRAGGHSSWLSRHLRDPRHSGIGLHRHLARIHCRHHWLICGCMGGGLPIPGAGGPPPCPPEPADWPETGAGLIVGFFFFFTGAGRAPNLVRMWSVRLSSRSPRHWVLSRLALFQSARPSR